GVGGRAQGLAEARALGQGERVVRPGRRHGRLAAQHVAHDLHVLARARERLRVRLAVPALDHLRARDPEAEHEPAAREVVHRQRGHGRRGRGARGELRDGRPEADAARARAPPRERRERVGAVGLRGPHRVHAEAVRGDDRVLDAVRRAGRPVAGVDAETHARSSSSRVVRVGAGRAAVCGGRGTGAARRRRWAVPGPRAGQGGIRYAESLVPPATTLADPAGWFADLPRAARTPPGTRRGAAVLADDGPSHRARAGATPQMTYSMSRDGSSTASRAAGVPDGIRTRAGTPTAPAPAGTSLTTTAFAPTCTSSPTHTGARIFAPAPTTTRSPSVGCRLPRFIDRPPSVDVWNSTTSSPTTAVSPTT